MKSKLLKLYNVIVETRKNYFVNYLFDTVWVLYLSLFVLYIFEASNWEYWYLSFSTLILVAINEFFKKK